MSPLFLSLRVGLLSTVIVFVIATSLTHFLNDKTFKGKILLESLLLLPLVLPPTVIGFGLIILFGKNGPFGILLEKALGVSVFFSWIGAVIASVIVSFPLMYQSAKAAFKKVDLRMIQVAQTMGISNWKIFWTITFPLALPGITSGTVLAFARGIGEFGATLMIAGYIPGKTDTIPLAIYFAVEGGNMKLALTLVGIILIVGLSAITWLNYWGERNH